MNNLGRFLTAGIGVLSAAVLVILFLFSDRLADNFGKGEYVQVRWEDFGEDQSSLTVEHEKVSFDGNGIFDPLDGVKATDCDGTDISYKVAVSYVSGASIQEKKISYVVYNSRGAKLTAGSRLTLSGYSGPDITCDAPESMTWEELQDITEALIKEKKLQGEDGFGNDVTQSIAASYVLDEDQAIAEITLSLQNGFGDVKLMKFDAALEG